MWSAVYLLIAVGLLVGFFLVADHIQTHTVPVGGITLNTTYSKYALGEPVSFSVTNNYNTTVFITNGCPSEPVAVYRQSGVIWERLHGTASGKDCSGEQRQVGIPASSTVTVSLAPWRGLFTKTGNYRLVAIIDGYSSLPYVDFSIMAPPTGSVAITGTTNTTITPKSLEKENSNNNGTTHSTSNNSTGASTSSGTSTPIPATTPAPTSHVPKTVTLHVTSAGNYDLTSNNLNVGDTLRIVYSPPIGNEVRTHFTAISPNATPMSSITVDSEFTSRSVVVSTAGSWSFHADDHNGNTGVLVVK